jgi:hypothetical protein
VAGFQHQADAERFLKDFQERLAKFGLEIQPEKTRLIAFGRFAASDCRKRGKGKPCMECNSASAAAQSRSPVVAVDNTCHRQWCP